MNDDGQTRAARRRARVCARRRQRRPTRTSSTPPPGTLSIAGRRRGERPAPGVSAQYLPETVQPYASTFDRYGSWRYDDVLRLRLVSDGQRRVAARTSTAAGSSCPLVRLDVDRRRIAWAWPTHHYGRWGFSAGAVVLDPRAYLGAGVGVVGVRPGLRELVPAGVGQQSRHRIRPRGILRRTLRSVARLDGRAAPAIRIRVRQQQLYWRDPHRCPYSRRVRRPRHLASVPRARRAETGYTDLRCRNPQGWCRPGCR